MVVADRATSPVTVTHRLPYTPIDQEVDSTRALRTLFASGSLASKRSNALRRRSCGTASGPWKAHTVAEYPGLSILNPSLGASGPSFGRVPTDAVHAPSRTDPTTITTAKRPSAVAALMLLTPAILAMVRACPVTISSVAILLALGLTLPACSPDTQALRADLTLYLQRANDWAPTEAETARTIDRILATQFVDEAEVRRQVGADAARVAGHLTRIQAVHPASPEVRDVHERYVSAWRRLDGGYVSLIRGLDTGNVPDIARGRRGLEEWRDGIVGVARELRRLRDDAGL